MMRPRLPILAILVLACPPVVTGCAERAPATASPQPPPTDTVVYGVPTAPESPVPQRPTTAVPTAGAVTVPPPEERGPLPRTQLTILHTNDTRGYLDPCG